jgi:uncharacterized protein
MTRDQALSILRQIKPSLVARYHLTRLGIFGSTARDEATAESDVDIVVEMPPISLWAVVGLREELEQIFGSSVDLVRYRDSLRPRLKRRIDDEAVYV